MVRLITAIALAGAALLLSGCYVSDELLLDTSSAVTPLADGTYANGSDRKYLTSSGDGQYLVYYYNKDGSLMSSADRMYMVRDEDLELGSEYVYLYAKEDSDIGWIYGLIVVDGNAVYEMHPDCDIADDRDIATKDGARYSADEDFGDECVFTDAGSVITALEDYYMSSDESGSPYYRQ
jgi:hypothetical protein